MEGEKDKIEKETGQCGGAEDAEETGEERPAAERCKWCRLAVIVLVSAALGALLLYIPMTTFGMPPIKCVCHDEQHYDFLQSPNGKKRQHEEYNKGIEICEKEREEYKTGKEISEKKRDEYKTGKETCEKRDEYKTGKGTCEKKRDEYKTGKETCEKKRDEYKTGKETWEKKRDEYKTGKETCEKKRDEYKTGKETWEKKRDEYKTGKETCEKKRDESKTGKETFEKKRDEYKTGKETCEKKRDEYKTGKETCEKKRDEYKVGQETCENKRKECQKEKQRYMTGEENNKQTLEVCKTEKEECIIKKEDFLKEHRKVKKILQGEILELQENFENLTARLKSQKEGAAVMIIGSIAPPPLVGWFWSVPFKDVVPLAPAKLSYDDHTWLTSLGLSSDKRDTLNVLLALYNEAKNVYAVHVSRPGAELSRSYILNEIEFLFKNTTKKDVILHYFGNGGRGRGDWCFGKEFITFNDIADLYFNHGRHRNLTIISDCHSSGQWVNDCEKYLHSHGIPVCGRLARDRGVLLKVYTSCKAGQNATDLRYITKGISFKDGRMEVYFKRDLGHQQTTAGADFTSLTCDKFDVESGIVLRGS